MRGRGAGGQEGPAERSGGEEGLKWGREEEEEIIGPWECGVNVLGC